MRVFGRVFLIWIAAVLAGGTALILFRNEGPSAIAICVNALLFLCGVVCSFICFREPVKNNKWIFLNFAVLFFTSVAALTESFVGYSLFPDRPNAQFYFYEYLQLGYFFFLSLAVVHVVIDSLFGNFRIASKYAVTLLIVCGFFAYYYYPFLENPKYLSTTEDVADYTVISQSIKQLTLKGNRNPSLEEVAAISDLGVWRDGKQVGTLFENQKVRRVQEILPYLREKSNYVSLFYKPLYLNNIYMNVLCVVFIFLFFGYQYKNDPPQGAYIEKIIFLFLPYCSLEILHHYAYIKSVQYSALLDVLQIGAYLTLVNLALLLLFFGLRLRFITSVKGEFYERELVSDAEHISRWRDAFDNLVVRHFLNPKAFHGRLFAPRAPRNET